MRFGTMNEKLVLGLGGTVDYEIVWDSRVIDDSCRVLRVAAVRARRG